MSVFLTLTPEAESRLRDSARQADKVAVRCILEDAIDPAVERIIAQSSSRLTEAEFSRLTRELQEGLAASLPPNFRLPPDDAFDRATFYDDPRLP